MKNIEIVVATDFNVAQWLVKENGYCPVECSFGNVSVVDALTMDHHGADYGHLESVAIRAYRDHFGARAKDPRFVVNHVDADCIFAIAALAGLLPHPSKAATLPPFLVKAWSQDLSALAETIAVIDTDPIGRDVLAMESGDILCTWNALYGFQAKDQLAAMAAVQGWLTLTTSPMAKTFIEAGKESEKVRRETALEDLEERGKKTEEVMVIKNTRVFGFGEWYSRNLNGSCDSEAGWDNPIVVTFQETGVVTIGCPNKQVAESLFGKGGLRNVFTALNEAFQCAEGAGFGGHEGIGGSPRGRQMTTEDLNKIGKIVNECIKPL